MEAVRIKLSAKKSNARSYGFVWCLGIPVEFAEKYGLKDQRVSLDAENGKIVALISNKGVTGYFSSRTYWLVFRSSTLGKLAPPSMYLSAVEFDGSFDPATMKIVINDSNYVKMMSDAVKGQTESHPNAEDLEKNDTFKVRPRQASAGRSIVAIRTAAPAPKPREIMRYTLPSKVPEWHDENIRALKQLINDLQTSRPDIVFQVVNGIVVMRRQVYEDI